MYANILTVVISLVSAGVVVDDAKPVTSVVDAYPSPSPDGSRVLFHSNRSGSDQIYVINADGSDLKQLTRDPGGSVTAKWSPDGKAIVYARGFNQTSDIWLMDTDGSNPRALVVTPGDDSHPQWTPDGKAIIFNTSRPAPSAGADGKPAFWDDIHLVQRDGSGMRRITDCKGTCTYPSLSPDGRRLVYRRVAASAGFDWTIKPIARNSEIVVAAIDGSGATTVAASPAFDGWPAWSPDGKWIAFASNRDRTPYSGQVYVVRPDGSGLRQATSGRWAHAQPAWSHDGRSLYVYRFQESADGEFGHVARVPFDPGAG